MGVGALTLELLEEQPAAAVSQSDPSAARSEVLQRVLDGLLDDAFRRDGELARRDVNRAYFRRQLTPEECGTIERQLKTHGVTVLDDSNDEDEPAAAYSVPSQTSVPYPASGYLTEAEEVDCGRRIQLAKRLETQGSSGDPEYDRQVMADAENGKRRLVETNMRYVQKFASKVSRRKHMLLEDLVQEGAIGLMRAAESYDPELGFRFKTYATWWIRQTIYRSLDDRDRMVRLPVHFATQSRKVKRAQGVLALLHGAPPTRRQLADYLGMDIEKLDLLLWRVEATNCAEADAPIVEDVSLISTLSDAEAPSAFDILTSKQLRKTLGQVLIQLSAREERVIRLRFGLARDMDHTLEAVGILFGVTRERIRQIESKALRKLFHPVRKRSLIAFLD